MISQYDLYDMTFALTLVRDDIGYELNNDILSKIICVLKDHSVMYEDNKIRKAVSSIDNLNCERWQFVYHNNVYVNHKFLTNYHIYELLIILCEEVCRALKNGSHEKAVDLIDCFHCLPEMIADNSLSVPKQFWKLYMNPYRNKWDSDLAKKEQKLV